MIRRRFADSRDGQVHLRESGPADAPVICFFHQTASSGVMFEQVMERLGDDYRCLSFDTPGFGQSFQPEAILDLRYCAERLIEAIGDCDVTDFHICGHHTGGCVALEMAPLLGPRLLSLTLIGPVLANAAERTEYAKIFTRPFVVEESGAFLQTAWDYLRMIGAGSDVDLHRREMADHLVAHRTMPMAFEAVWRQDAEALYRAVEMPLHIMCSREDVLWPLFERAGELRPDARRSIVGGADFQPDRDPEGVARELAVFVAEVENRRG